ncbi:MAG: hypothetical protein HKN43_10510 [Rhodothermales bacterium]|nr:hypothetical protein [Rhodothermales bacterium]
MVTLRRQGKRLVLSVNGINKFWALKSSVNIPFSCIDEVRVNLDDSVSIWSGLRVPGTFIPGYLRAGTYLTRGGKHFYLRRRGNESIVFELSDHKYSRAVVDVPDPIDAVSQVLTWMEELGINND